MHLIKVNAINSTNSFAREMFRENSQMPLTCIIAKKQLQGRGQRGTNWNSEEGKNLTFSVLLPDLKLNPARQFLLSAAVATSLVSSLEKLQLPRLRVKWPNDILSANQKIAGILIENIISEGKVVASVIGIGLNVNQTQFDDLPKAASMKTVSGRDFETEEVLELLLKDLENSFGNISEENSEAILKAYEKWLFRKDMPSTFKDSNNRLFTGMITGVSNTGMLRVQTDDEEIREFDLKEIELCY